MSQHHVYSLRARRRAHSSLNGQHRPHRPGRRSVVAAQRERAQIVASLFSAADALPADPDAAALLLDGALSAMLDQWAAAAHVAPEGRRVALSALEVAAPAVAWRLRLALQAHNPAARLAHCWALLELLTRMTSESGRDRSGDERHNLAVQPIHQRNRDSEARKDDMSHVS